MSVEENILDAIATGLRTITVDNGYSITIGDINKEEVAFSDRMNFPSVDILWGPEIYLNTIEGKHTTGAYEKVADIFIEGWLNAQENMFAEKIKFKNAIEKYFGTNYIIPNGSGVGTAFNCMLANNALFGMKRNDPKGGVSMLLKVYYRIELTDPNTAV